MVLEVSGLAISKGLELNGVSTSRGQQGDGYPGKGFGGCAGKERWYSMVYERSRSSPLGLGGKSEFQRIFIKGEGEEGLQHSCVGHEYLPSYLLQNTPDSLLGSYWSGCLLIPSC